MSLSSRKQHGNAGTERKQFTENASVALQQPIMTHAHTKCSPVAAHMKRTRLYTYLKLSWTIMMNINKTIGFTIEDLID